MILTGVDTNHEDLLPWWLNNAIKHNTNENIGVWDFGMSSTMREKIQKEYLTTINGRKMERRINNGDFVGPSSISLEMPNIIRYA